MSLEALFEQFELLADAPNGVQKLRELILQLAVQGKLVPQDPNDEPASVLLERIEAEKKRLVKEGKIQKENPLPPLLDNEEVTTQLPQGWVRVRLGEVINCLDYRRKPVNKAERQVRQGNIPYYGANGQVGWIDDYLFDEPLVLVVEDETFIGRQLPFCYKISGKSWVNNHAHVLQPTVGIDVDFLNYSLAYYPFISLTSGTTGRKKLTKSTLLNVPYTLPPLPEQERIIAKVDRLMSLCDELEARQEKRHDRILELGEVATSQLLTPRTPEAFNQHWQGICDNFDLLYSTPENVSQLRQAILQLAVMGKLVPWEESKDNLENLIEEIYRENFAFNLSKRDREQVLREFEIVRQNAHSYNSGLFKIKAMCICDFITKGTTPASNELLPEGDIPYIKVYNIIKNKLDFFYNPVFISKITHETKLKRSKVFPGDVLMNIVGPPLGKVAIVNDEFPEWNINQALAIFRPVKSIDNKFLYYVLSCYSTLEEVLKETKGTAGQDNLSLEQCRNLQIPLYPLSIQKCIVAKVEQLMSLCDELEAKLMQSINDREKLMETAVRQVLAA
jgi:type I restriction enzyme S subunit